MEGERSFDDAFESLFMTAYRVAFRLLGSRVDAQDVAQDSLVKAALKWARVADHAEPWIAKVAADGAIDLLRRQRRRGQPEDSDVEAFPSVFEERLDLTNALRALPARQRQVLVLRYIADLPEKTVAKALGCSVGSVKSHASRALAHLRQVLTIAPTDEG